MKTISVFQAFFIGMLMLCFGACNEDETANTNEPNTEAEPPENQEEEEPVTEIPVNYSEYNFEEPEVTGNSFYIDPVNGSQDGDGSEANPWKTLQQVIEDKLIQYY